MTKPAAVLQTGLRIHDRERTTQAGGASAQFTRIARAFERNPGVSQGSKRFSAGALKVNNRSFAMFSFKGEFVCAGNLSQRFDQGHSKESRRTYDAF